MLHYYDVAARLIAAENGAASQQDTAPANPLEDEIIDALGFKL